MTRLAAAGCAVLVALAACSGESPDPESLAANTIRPEPVVVYAAHDDPTYWPDVFAGFTRETGIRVTVRQRDAGTIVNEVIENHGTPPADILLTPSVHGAWLAADEGALRPLQSDLVATHVDAALRDPDGYWAAVRMRSAVIVHAADFADAAGITGFLDLGKPEYAGQLCLTTSSLPLNRVLIATLIDLHGARAAELTVRQWIANLSLPPIDNESELRDAINAGTCKLGILSSDEAAELAVIDGLADALGVVDIDGIGIARHAREPESALRLIEWLLESGAAGPLTADGAFPVARAAWRIDDAIRLAERAGFY